MPHDIAHGPISRYFREESRRFRVEELLRAQSKSWNALKEVRQLIKPGITEVEGAKLAANVLRELGSPRSWHHPLLRIGSNTANPYHTSVNLERRLLEDDIFYIDIGPIWADDDGNEYEGDVGDTFTFQENAEYLKCIETNQRLFREACEKWKYSDATGAEIYRWLEVRAQEEGYYFVAEDDGHRIGNFPHKRIFSGSLNSVNFKPSSGIWVLEVHIANQEKSFGAFFEDILR